MSIKKTLTRDYTIGYKSDVIPQYGSTDTAITNFSVHVRRSGSFAGSGDDIGFVVEMDKKLSTAGSEPSENTTVVVWSAPEDDTGETNMGCLYLLSSSVESSVGAGGATTNRWGGNIAGQPSMRLTSSAVTSPSNGGSGAHRKIGSANAAWSSSTLWPLRHHGLAVDCNVWDGHTSQYIHRVFAGSCNHYDTPAGGGSKVYIGAVHVWNIPAGKGDTRLINEHVLTASTDAASGDRFGADVCAVTNNFASYFFVSAPGKTMNAKSSQGLVYAYGFEKNNNIHRANIPLASIQSPINEASAHWAGSLSASGTILVGGMHNKSSVGVVQQTSATTWAHRQTLVHPSGSSAASGWLYGADVSVDGGWLAVGAPKDKTTEGASHSGAGMVFLYQSGSSSGLPTYTLKQVVNPTTSGNDITRGSHFGASVSLDGKYLVVGQPYYDSPSNYPGRAYVYEYIGSVWTLIKTIDRVGSNTYTYLGQSVATKGGVAVLGSVNDHTTTDSSGDETGIVNIYDATSVDTPVNRGQPFRYGAKTVANLRGNKAGTDIKTLI